MIEGQRLGGVWDVWHDEKDSIESLYLEGGVAYHLDGVLTAVVDGSLLDLVGVVDARISRSLSICVPLISFETS